MKLNKQITIQRTCFNSDSRRWEAIQTRDCKAGGVFIYAVKTTGVYCRPTCRSRKPLRANVRFFDTTMAAEQAGFRPCRRCKPNHANDGSPHRKAVLLACRLLDESEPVTLRKLGDLANLSPYHFQRVFKQTIGVTPKQYAMARRTNRLREELRRNGTVTQAIYGAGYVSSSRVYENANGKLGMHPSAYRNGGQHVTIRFALANTDLGPVLIATTNKGVCAIEFGDTATNLRSRLSARFPKAERIEGGRKIERMALLVSKFVAAPSVSLGLPLDIQGTAFQQQVWQALRRIPIGRTVTYKKVANSIGAPKSVRAVAQACAQNRLAMAIPCHRVVRSDGSPSGYRWGIKRKQKLLQKEGKTLAVSE